MPAATLLLLASGGGLIGFLLSVLGAGGSILLLPLLVSGAGLSTQEAVPISLLVVMLLALGNLGPYLRRGQFAPRPALILGMPALAGSWIGGSWVKAGLIPEPVQLGVFTVAALLASWLLTHRRKPAPQPGAPIHGAGNQEFLLALQGLLVGLLTGVAGVGGGFAIVPALVLLAGLPMALASGTSLLLIAVNAVVALLAVGHWPTASLPLILPLALGGVVGGTLGQRIGPRLSEQRLRRGFSALLLVSALLSGLEAWRRQHQPVAHLPSPASSRQLAGMSPEVTRFSLAGFRSPQPAPTRSIVVGSDSTGLSSPQRRNRYRNPVGPSGARPA